MTFQKWEKWKSDSDTSFWQQFFYDSNGYGYLWVFQVDEADLVSVILWSTFQKRFLSNENRLVDFEIRFCQKILSIEIALKVDDQWMAFC